MVLRGVLYSLCLSTILLAQQEQEVAPLPVDSEPLEHFYVESPFIDLESLLESSDTFAEQFRALSEEERQLFVEVINEFNKEFQKIFTALTI
jgi:hypothetical protein